MMLRKLAQPLLKELGRMMAITALVLGLVWMTTLGALADSVIISDNAGVLNVSQVRSEAASLPNPVSIFTIPDFTGSKATFDQSAVRTIPNPNTIVIAIGTSIHHVAIVGGRSVGLSKQQYNNAITAFTSSMSGGNYTNATIAALHSLQDSLGGSGLGGLVTGRSGGLGSSTLCCLGFLILAGIALFAVVRRRRSGGGFFNRSYYNQPYNQGPYPPNYGPGYYNQGGGGMNPLAAGGLGAAAGGLVGYELGKEAGEREERDRDFGGDFGNGGDFGGGASGDFGGGGGGDFGGGGGGGDFGGGGGDFGGGGGGGGGDFGGGGGDFGGGGGGGGDFGGGSGGNW